MTVAIGEGASAQTISRAIRQYLNDPDLMFRRFRYKDENGNWQRKWKKRIIDPETGKHKWIDYDRDSYRTGSGVYKSSAKNAMRVARTETNIAYRHADQERWQQLDFVCGMHIEVSRSHPLTDICDTLAGNYPKNFVFEGCHPQCFCVMTPILVTDDEMLEMADARMRGEEYTPRTPEVTDVPDNFKNWVADNADNIAASRERGTEPYFLRNNAARVDEILHSSSGDGSSIPPNSGNYEVADMSEANITPQLEQIPREKNLYTNEYCEQILHTFDEVTIVAPWGEEGLLEYADEIPDRIWATEFTNLDVLSLDKDIRKTLSDFGLQINRTTLQIAEEGGITISWKGNDVEMKRRFFIDEESGVRMVDHELFVLSKELQGNGMSKALFRDLYKEYRAAGIEQMNVHANIDVGGYTWGRYGFCVRDKDSALGAINYTALTIEEETQIVDIIDNHFASSKAPFCMNEIARLPFGKEALLGMDWAGELDLTNSELRKYFEHYIKFKN